MFAATLYEAEADEILIHAADFLNGGVERMFAPASTASDAKLAVVAIQTAVELLVKRRLVRKEGLASIHQPPVPGKRPMTIGFGKCIEAINNRDPLRDAEREIVREAQELRNRLVHIGVDIDVDAVRIQLAHLLVHALALFAAGEERDEGGMQTYRRFLTSKNFTSLTTFEPYRAEAIDAALDGLDTDDVYPCWECGESALSFRGGTDAYFCTCCGLSASQYQARYTDCAACTGRKCVCYDPLNPQRDGFPGKCVSCGRMGRVRKRSLRFVPASRAA